MLHSPSPGPALFPDSLAQGSASVLAWQQLPVPSFFPPCAHCRALSWRRCSAERGRCGAMGHQAGPVLLRVGGSSDWMGSLLLSPSHIPCWLSNNTTEPSFACGPLRFPSSFGSMVCHCIRNHSLRDTAAPCDICFLGPEPLKTIQTRWEAKQMIFWGFCYLFI